MNGIDWKLREYQIDTSISNTTFVSRMLILILLYSQYINLHKYTEIYYFSMITVLAINPFSWTSKPEDWYE